ncbi:hypothetical protein QMK19_03555 [Streptomyces sp. H10-C2]|uniref:hypothetical protein n=1 Tax=unclassified Streptomyces TaxID=2593676 RepID=UPI0024BB9EC5|nr:MULTISPECIES: hypothetical protein [unclassified Streptomyces]MDJ0342263.1 hypothetical protein [Streptomyces sp. PH10-H1]MDJ0368777.1 hypothetical protein [Streptomyces sp. H10-C2]
MTRIATEPDGRPLTSCDPEPPLGTMVLCLGARWINLGDGWVQADGEGDPESWAKIAGNYGPVTVVTPTPERVFLLTEYLHEVTRGPLVFASHEAARRWAAGEYSTTERGWWKSNESRWQKRIKRRKQIPPGFALYFTGREYMEVRYLSITEHEVRR